MDMNGAETYDEDLNDQPVDYSKKYIERNAPSQTQRLANGSQTNRVLKKEFDKCDNKVDLFSDYAETDLDQPTDYSLRYAEDDTDEEEKQSAEYFHGSEQEDTVKTYCTEGTPYETPFNFSTATSMSDLRVEDMKENELVKKIPKKTIQVTNKSPVSFIKQTETLSCDEQDNLITKELEEENPKDDVVLNPGQVTPEKIVSYYEEEETSRGFSRANSLSSLSSAMTPQNNITGVISKEDLSPPTNKEELENNHNVVRLSSNQIELSSVSDSSSENKNSPRVLDKEGKMVTFGGQDYYAEETPLMFSRCSSLGSLSGFEQYSIHDDRSSVISDFSRRTSGVVSPSELPDSPTQTVLPSPRNHKIQNTEFISKIQEEAVRPSVRHLLFPKQDTIRNSVFEDDIATFKEESTPIEFSSATSLSSLTIDDEVKIPDNTKTYCAMKEVFDTSNKDIHRLETDMLNMTINNSDSNVKEEQVSDGDEDDEDMLAACINMGMQTNRYRQSLKTLDSQKSIQSESTNILALYKKNSIPSRLESHTTPVKPVDTSKTNRTVMEMITSDTVHVYCTEDTPADISPVGSHSNLSALSMPSVQEEIICEQDKSTEIDCHRNNLFDENSNLSGEDEKILDECIQSGMPKARQITPPPTNGISFVKKSETLPHKFNIYGTPSSSPIETNHGNKNSILSPKSPSGASLRHPDEFSDDSLNHSDDDAILTECIQSAMPKARFSLSTRLPLTQVMESKTMNIQSSTSSTFFQPKHVEQRKNIVKKLSSFEDNVELSEEEEDIMLAQCIRSGMPKALNSMPSTSVASIAKKSETSLKATGNFSTPSSSCFTNKAHFPRNTMQYSSSYKSMNINNTADMRFAKNVPSNFNYFPEKATSSNVAQTGQMLKNSDNITRERINNSPHCARRSPLRHTENRNNITVDNFCMPLRSRVVKCVPTFNRIENDDDYTCKNHNTIKSNTMPSRHSSISSLNEESSLISTEEWALLELCITSGRNKCRLKGTKPNESTISNGHDDCEPIPEDNYSVCSYNSYVCKT
ncbi:adenomatous polyposis coli homolog isoform X1 [Pogonomyrmex barbatus]|uniref:Adenomatous polyposis coli homolog isoform X1 n=1 Tax=Pogonomyrmex barbatus TaxID=144034 RepID=A0A6I9WKZ9_9HYME|nr:adenomatous polyposis coli homolog isoform X1 [Pogonomyrmex barbatus]XP_011642214.1 adenomatous polyposis coli homolog isoform X1 [Pogonomyrmex barbatus]XP_025074916.1 adenomatous polyposis coli homolog isoform X1 [Pogonomyrmex barbatus]